LRRTSVVGVEIFVGTSPNFIRFMDFVIALSASLSQETSCAVLRRVWQSRQPFINQVIFESGETQSAAVQNRSLAAVVLEGIFEWLRAA